MLPEEFRDIEQTSNTFQKALYELDYGMNVKELIAELQEVDERIAKTEMRATILNMQRSKLCDAIIEASEVSVVVVSIKGRFVAARIDSDNVQIVSVLIDDSCEVQNGDL